MKQAVISSGGHQYLVKVGDQINVELVSDATKSLEFQPLMVIDDDKSEVGKPYVTSSTVNARIVEEDVKGEKVTAIRYKAKKRVRKIRGHRQRHTTVEITKIV